MGCRLKRFAIFAALIGVFNVAASPAFGATYFVTVAGLGGEPDYEQRFTMLATDVDKILHSGGQTDRVVETLKGADATKVKMEAALNRIAAQAKPAEEMSSIPGLLELKVKVGEMFPFVPF